MENMHADVGMKGLKNCSDILVCVALVSQYGNHRMTQQL